MKRIRTLYTRIKTMIATAKETHLKHHYEIDIGDTFNQFVPKEKGDRAKNSTMMVKYRHLY